MSDPTTLLRMKRLRNELKQLRRHPLENAEAYPIDTTMLKWECMVYGPKDSPFEGGEYIVHILLPSNYPNRPPDFMMMTPSGRFTPANKICLSNSGYHSESWSPAWTIKSILVGMISIMLDDFENGISHIHASPQEQRRLAAASHMFNEGKYPTTVAKFRELEQYRRLYFEKQAEKERDSKATAEEKPVVEEKKAAAPKVKKPPTEKPVKKPVDEQVKKPAAKRRRKQLPTVDQTWLDDCRRLDEESATLRATVQKLI